MRFSCGVLPLVFGLTLMSAVASGQAQRDPQAVAIATQAYKALGGALPTDSRAIGNYNRVIGSSKDTGSIEILTRGYDQTSQKITNSGGTTQVVYSKGYASQWDQSALTRFTLERSLSSDSAVFPLMVIAPAVLDPNSTVQFVASEFVNGKAANHIRICPSSPDQNFTNISSFGSKDVWVDISSGLPLEISYQVLDGQGGTPIPVAVFFSNYQSSSGVTYPFQIQESLNGTPYMAVSITSVAFGVGLSDQDFPLQ
jgi:hypothetical protein